jgi:hypothetical protein
LNKFTLFVTKDEKRPWGRPHKSSSNACDSCTRHPCLPPLSLNNWEENPLNLTYGVWNLSTKSVHTSCFDLSNLPCAQSSKLCTHFLCFAHICFHELLFLQTQTPSLSLLLWELQTLILSFTMNVSLKKYIQFLQRTRIAHAMKFLWLTHQLRTK